VQVNEEATLMPAADNEVRPLQDWGVASLSRYRWPEVQVNEEAIIMLVAGDEVVPLQDWGVALLSRYP
jgi:hypothetical protein